MKKFEFKNVEKKTFVGKLANGCLVDYKLIDISNFKQRYTSFI